MYLACIFQFLFKIYFKCICFINKCFPYKNITIIDPVTHEKNRGILLWFMLCSLLKIDYVFDCAREIYIDYKSDKNNFRTIIMSNTISKRNIKNAINTIIQNKNKKIILNKHNVILNEILIDGTTDIKNMLNNYVYFNGPIYLNSIAKIQKCRTNKIIIKYYINFQPHIRTIDLTETNIDIDEISSFLLKN
jgi:hypothetical protein